VFAVVSHYEPLGLVGFEAAAHGVPVVATEEVGALPHLVEYGVGKKWAPGDSFKAAVTDIVSRRESCIEGALRMEKDLGADAYGKDILALYDRVRAAKVGQSSI
jgi:glycosyltransferase involved in cell wall biosynthesis